jgi:putative transposase
MEDGNGADEVTVIDSAVGIDVDLEQYAVDSDGHEIENPHWLKSSLKRLRREQRKLIRKEKGSKNREKQRIIVAQTHERVQNQRNDFQHKLARSYVDEYDLIVTEKLQPGNMVRDHKLARNISDAAWSAFNQKIAYKAERAGKLFVQVDARGTSQTCPTCGRVEVKTLSQRTHDCPCGFRTGRDHASSLVVLDRGTRKVRPERPELTLVDRRPLHGSANSMQAGWLKQEAQPVRVG